MIRISVPPEDIGLLRDGRYNHPDARVQRKMEAVLLKSEGLPHAKIASLVGVSQNTMLAYFRDYKRNGVEELKKTAYYRPSSALAGFKDALKEHFENNPPSSIKKAIADIENLTGIKRSQTQVRKFLRSIGMERRKTGTIPAKADVERQETFKKETLEPMLNEAREYKRIVFFVDAAHFVLATFLGYLWCFKRVFVKSPSGRQRFNVLGALNAVTHEITMVTNDTYINALSVCELLQAIAKRHVGIPISVVLDNARYQQCELVKQLATDLGIDLVFLPTYSPNLNLIERLWKFTKKECLNGKYYEDFKTFRQAIALFLEKAHQKHKMEFASLFTHRFQTLGKERAQRAKPQLVA